MARKKAHSFDDASEIVAKLGKVDLSAAKLWTARAFRQPGSAVWFTTPGDRDLFIVYQAGPPESYEIEVV